MVKLKSKPKVSIGLPVYNGEKFLRTTIDSLLGQTFKDFEIVICDNASIDRTEQICREYAAKDSRICYHRNSKNIGAAANFNLTFELSSGQYFKWAAHDDICKPEYLERCVENLCSEKKVVLSHSYTMIIDEDGEKVENNVLSFPFDSVFPSERFKEALDSRKCYEIFGLIRRSALLKTPLMGNYGHADGVLLAHLALLGPFKIFPAFLFCVRRHPQQSTHMCSDYRQYALWFDPKVRGKILFPFFRRYFEYFRTVCMVSLKAEEFYRCCKYLANDKFFRRYKFKKEIEFFVSQKIPRLMKFYQQMLTFIKPKP
jgi:glycosyltransferase involved in cell wall biosynthesis